MRKFNPDKNIKKMICTEMGEDFDDKVCEELSQFMNECPECKVYYDSVKKVVKLYKISNEEQKLPEDVSDRLFKTLNLKEEN